MSKFSRWTPTLGVCFKWDSQKVLKIAHLGVFRHIGGTWGVQKHMYLKVYWVKVISSKNGDVWTPQCWEINFFRQNICMFDWLYTETYTFLLYMMESDMGVTNVVIKAPQKVAWGYILYLYMMALNIIALIVIKKLSLKVNLKFTNSCNMMVL